MREKMERRTFLKSVGGEAFLIGLSAYTSPLSVFGSVSKPTNKPKALNVLLIIADDLRPMLGCYGDPAAITPNIDALAQNGVVFENAYAQAPLCNPSRASMLTGCRPDTIGVHMNHERCRDRKHDLQTLPQWFKRRGYHTQSIGKIFHNDDIASWSVPSIIPRTPVYGNKTTLEQVRNEGNRLDELKEQQVQKDPETGLWTFLTMPGPSWEAAEVEDNYLYDGNVAKEGIKALRELKNKPFFLGLGFAGTHLPFVAPRKYFEMYDESAVRLPENDLTPENCPEIAVAPDWVNEWTRYKDLRKVRHVPKTAARQLIRAYYAAVSYVDMQVGKVLKELDRLGLRDDTVIVLWGDQGMTLKEHDLWGKETLFDVANHCPLIINAPGWRNEHKQVKAVVEALNIYPTLCDLCILDMPGDLEGTSLVPLMRDPNTPWNKPAFSQMWRGDITGYSMRTERYRYTEWRKGSEIIAGELYGHSKDAGETVNVAAKPENAKLVAELSEQMGALLSL